MLIAAVKTSNFGHHHVFICMRGGTNKVTNTKVKHNQKVIMTKNKNITSLINVSFSWLTIMKCQGHWLKIWKEISSESLKYQEKGASNPLVTRKLSDNTGKQCDDLPSISSLMTQG